MSSKYLSSPVNISRFIEMSARSISPQREISQMTPQKQFPQNKITREAKGNSTESVKPEDVLHEVSHPEENMAENTAYLLQCGSPLYDPVKEIWRCWNGHELRIKERSQYGAVDGVSCDFCGFTDWLEVLEGTGVGMKGKRRGKKAIKRREKEAEPRYFYHCDVCDMDLCTHCAKDLRVDSRYHVPCMQCRRCLVFMRNEEAALHHCYLKRAREVLNFMTPSTSTSGGASSSSFTESVATLTSFRPRESSPPVISMPPDPTRASTQFPIIAWEVCVKFENATAEAEVRKIGESLSLRGIETPGVPDQLIFRTPTRLAAEELAQHVHEKGLFASIRRFRA
ncbi:hypothetical protein C3747_63g146 [Trypanosoma cruzi]|uniref:Uncharacterized protein n=2 Tax=Trypanosoma cruzi TaxID=5693 RepID=Q4DX55_TRYCC|nr:hypothetical protein, conserved [Trypanosoma cruzi]EAN97085.1 hypothetical protein, conserved [Trypanosoma cruzi]PWV11095.1 hypothetical protein C3747_63g146 [Trypanosoma cruzi]RNC46950.1 hypothetical protein TcCL_NonESM03211 [Trypanosoma cruzi]|eukprot:XP_818936.1 hypothetical protein [Trypanosoma cruzi strain CL Brener]